MSKKPYMITADSIPVKGTDRVFYPAVNIRTDMLQPTSDIAWQAKMFSSEERIYAKRENCLAYCKEQNASR
jgi:hypothetical protein